jgi:hypothetical protein
MLNTKQFNKEKIMNDTNILATVAGIVAITLIGSFAYVNIVDSNNSKEIVTAAIARGLDPVAAACAGQISTASKDVRSTCEKLAIIKGK